MIPPELREFRKELAKLRTSLRRLDRLARNVKWTDEHRELSGDDVRELVVRCLALERVCHPHPGDEEAAA